MTERQNQGLAVLRMPPFRLAIGMPSPGWPADYGFAIDHPLPGESIRALTTNFRGFVAPKGDSTKLPTSIIFMVGGIEAWRAPVELARPDLADSQYAAGARRMDMRCGFDTVLPSFLNPKGGPVLVCIETEGSDRPIPMAEVSFEGGVQPVPHDGIGVLTVNSLGRSGSSVLCRMLSLHSKLYVPKLGGQFGEVFAAGHLARSLAVLGSEGALSSVNRVYDDPDFAVLPHGYTGMDVESDGLEQQCRNEMQDAAIRAGVDAFRGGLNALTRLARARKPRAVCWVEKSWSSPSAPLLGLLGREWREILLVRDPQDFFLSQALFQIKSRVPFSLIADHLNGTPEKFLRIYSSYRSRRDFVHLVRYEDLISDPRGVLEGIVQYMKLGPSKGFIDKAVKVLTKDDEFRRMLSTRQGGDAKGETLPELPSFDASTLGSWFSDMCKDFGYAVPERLGRAH